MTTPSDLLSAELRRDGSRPLLTYYNDAVGERVELSVATAANWVAKTANYLTDEHGIDAGDPVGVLLPLHWQTAIVLLASWATGAVVAFDPDPTCRAVFCDDQHREAAGRVVADAEVVVLSLAPMGVDFSRLVAAQPDIFVPAAASGEDLVDAVPIDLPNGARVLSVLPYDRPDALSHGLIGPLAVSGSVVLVADPDPAGLAAHAATERVTHTLGVTISGLPRLDS